MTIQRTITLVYLLVVFIILAQNAKLTYAKKYDIGICYGTQGDNLPPVADVIAMYKNIGIDKIRLFEPLHEALDALRGSDTLVSLGIRNEDLANIATDPAAAGGWVGDNVVPYAQEVNIGYVSVGNEAVPGDGVDLGQAMTNIHNALVGAGLTSIKVTTVISLDTLGTSYPPSQGAFKDATLTQMQSIVSFLATTGFPLMVNVYPYFAYASNPSQIDLSYALCRPNAPPVQDGDLTYICLVDSMVDAVYSAMEKIGGENVGIVISEVGWPSAGNGEMTTPALAQEHNVYTALHVVFRNGTPKRPNLKLETFFFAMFNEDLKPAGIEQNWGFFYPNKTPVYEFF